MFVEVKKAMRSAIGVVTLCPCFGVFFRALSMGSTLVLERCCKEKFDYGDRF